MPGLLTHNCVSIINCEIISVCLFVLLWQHNTCDNLYLLSLITGGMITIAFIFSVGTLPSEAKYLSLC